MNNSQFLEAVEALRPILEADPAGQVLVADDYGVRVRVDALVRSDRGEIHVRIRGEDGHLDDRSVSPEW